MREFKASTKRGQDIISRAGNYIGTYLREVYNSWSSEKEQAYNDCLEMFRLTENSTAFGICSKNTYGFTCSWLGTQDGENILRYETKDNSYLVWLDR